MRGHATRLRERISEHNAVSTWHVPYKASELQDNAPRLFPFLMYRH